jgi:glycosyltransferase involved in cell wall biosynthesis
MNSAGAQEAMMRLMRQLRARGHETETWFLYEKSDCYRGQPGVEVILPKARLGAIDLPVLFLRLVKMLKTRRPDAVVGFLPLANVLGQVAAHVAGVKVRIASQRSPGPTFNPVMQFLDRELGAFGIYTRIICVSQAVRESFANNRAAYRARLCVVNNGIEWNPSALDKATARAGFAIPPDMPLLVASGRFVPQKNYDLMVRVLATAPNMRLAIAGDGPLRAAAQAVARDMGAEDRIHFLGVLPHRRVIDLLRAADGFVQTSLFEGQSNSTLEAMHEGLPIICSDIAMQRETLCDEDGTPAALLVPLDDFDGWRSAFLRVRDDPVAAAALGARARALVSEQFTLARMIDGFEEAIVRPQMAAPSQVAKKYGVEHADVAR